MSKQFVESNGTVSIIVPVYNVERYLIQCLDSIASQTYQDLEILIINDESPDQCGLIMDAYAQKDPRFKVFHIKNRGAAGARNIGLDNCSGSFIMFVDSDDWLEENAVETMMKAMQCDQSDIVQCQFTNEYVGETIPDVFIDEEKVITDAEYAEKMMQVWEYVLLWNKLFKREVLAGLKMVEGHCIDDEFFTYKTIMHSSRITLIKDSLYHYRMRKSGATGNPDKEQQILRDHIDFVVQRTPELISHYPKQKSAFLTNAVILLIDVMNRCGNDKIIYNKAKSELKKFSLLTLPNKSVDINIKKSVINYIFRAYISSNQMPLHQMNDTKAYYE